MTLDIVTTVAMYLGVGCVVAVAIVLLFPTTQRNESGVLVYAALFWGPALFILLIMLLYWGFHALVVSRFLSQETRQAMRLEHHRQQASQQEQAR